MIQGIKKLFGIYDENYEYWVYTKTIKVPPEFRKHRIGFKKFNRKKKYWYQTGNFESKVILDRHNNLLDGYSTVRIAEIKGIDKIPAYYVKDPDSYKATLEQERLKKKK